MLFLKSHIITCARYIKVPVLPPQLLKLVKGNNYHTAMKFLKTLHLKILHFVQNDKTLCVTKKETAPIVSGAVTI